MRKPDVLVIGVGRTGTSFVSSVLHDKLNVCMGHNFHGIENNDSRKLTLRHSYECIQMWRETLRIVGKEIFDQRDLKKQLDNDVTSWLERFGLLHKNCSGLCGTKCIHLAWLTPRQLLALQPKLVVRTWRSKQAILTSTTSPRRKTLEQRSKFYDSRESNMIDLELKTAGKIEFVWIRIPDNNAPRMTEEEVIAILQPYINRIKEER